MNRLHPNAGTTELLAIAVSLAGSLVMLGWIFDIGVLKSIRPEWVTMKFSTAFSFFCSGIILHYTARLRFKQPSLAFAILPAATLCIALTMFTLLASTLFDVYVGIEALFVREELDAVETVLPGRPSVGTMTAFMLIASAGIISMLEPVRLPQQLFALGCLIFVVGLLAVIGYIFDVPILYYYVQEGGFSSAMALHTALLFMLLGIGLIRLK